MAVTRINKTENKLENLQKKKLENLQRYYFVCFFSFDSLNNILKVTYDLFKSYLIRADYENNPCSV